MAAGRGGDGSAAFGGTDPAAGGKCAQDRVLFRRPHFDAGAAAPLLGTDLSALELDLAPYREAIEERQAELEAQSDQELEQLIAERTGAYILEEAARLGMQIQVRVETVPRRRRYAGSGESGNHGSLFRAAVGVDCAGIGNSRGGAGLA